MTGLNGDNKVNDFTQVSNSASARSGAGFRGVRFYISLKPLKFSPYNLEADIHIGFKQRIPILHHSEKVQKKIILHRSQTRWSSRVSTFVLEVDHFTQVSNNELPPKKSTAVLKVNHFTQVSILDDLKKNLKKSFGGINFTQDSSLELDESGNQVSLEVFDFTQVLNGGTLWICLRFGSILFCIGLKLCTQLHTETRLQR